MKKYSLFPIIFLFFSLNSYSQEIVHALNYTRDSLQLEIYLKPEMNHLNSIVSDLNKLRKELVSAKDSQVIFALQTSIDSLKGQIEKSQDKVRDKEFEFFKKNPESLIALDRLRVWFLRHDGASVADTIYQLYNSLTKQLKQSKNGLLLKSQFEHFRGSLSGQKAPNFTFVDSIGSKKFLSEICKGKTILLDFWASWCTPCRADIPSLKKIYQKYKDKGLEIIAISQDSDSLKWKRAITIDSTEIWKHILIPPRSSTTLSPILDMYFVYGIPVKVLISKEGIIYQRWRGGDEEVLQELEKKIGELLDN